MEELKSCVVPECIKPKKKKDKYCSIFISATIRLAVILNIYF